MYVVLHVGLRGFLPFYWKVELWRNNNNDNSNQQPNTQRQTCWRVWFSLLVLVFVSASIGLINNVCPLCGWRGSLWIVVSRSQQSMNVCRSVSLLTTKYSWCCYFSQHFAHKCNFISLLLLLDLYWLGVWVCVQCTYIYIHITAWVGSECCERKIKWN